MIRSNLFLKFRNSKAKSFYASGVANSYIYAHNTSIKQTYIKTKIAMKLNKKLR